MASKVIAQLIIQFSSIFTRAAAQAYGQALQNAKRGGGAAAAGMGKNASKARLFKMQPQEALDILNIQKSDLTQKAVNEAFENFYKLNDPAKGGSFYLQSKFYRAKEALDYELNPDKLDEEDGTDDGNDDIKGANKAAGAAGGGEKDRRKSGEEA